MDKIWDIHVNEFILFTSLEELLTLYNKNAHTGQTQ